MRADLWKALRAIRDDRNDGHVPDERAYDHLKQIATKALEEDGHLAVGLCEHLRRRFPSWSSAPWAAIVTETMAYLDDKV